MRWALKPVTTGYSNCDTSEAADAEIEDFLLEASASFASFFRRRLRLRTGALRLGGDYNSGYVEAQSRSLCCHCSRVKSRMATSSPCFYEPVVLRRTQYSSLFFFATPAFSFFEGSATPASNRIARDGNELGPQLRVSVTRRTAS
jgi:hypothetical protein